MLLIARNKEKLDETAMACKQHSDGTLTVLTRRLDLAKATDSDMTQVIADCLASMTTSAGDDEDQAVIIHNAGSLGDISKKLSDVHDIRESSQYFTLNLANVVTLNSHFLHAVGQAHIGRVFVVNISSLCAVQPMKYMALYCSGKAARDMLFQVLAQEEKSVRVLSYAPGPLDGEMQEHIRANLGDKASKEASCAMHTEKKLVTLTESAEKLTTILTHDLYKSGDHVDYYDPLPA